MARFLCTGDSHIGAGRDLAPDRLAEQERVWRDTLTLARSERVDTVLHGGDLWERRRPSPDEYLAAERPLVEHRAAAGCPVLIIAGNHDRSGVDDNLALRVLEQARLIRLSTEPEVMHGITRNDVMVCTLPWTPVSRLVAQQDGGDRDAVFQQAAELLIQTAADLRAQVDGPAVLMLHWSVSGASLPSGLPIEMAREVILPLDALEAIGFDAIVCAHVHRQQELLGGLGGPMSFYVGSPMPLNFGEGDQEHGVWILDSSNWRANFHPLSSRPFVTLTPDESVRADLDLNGAFVKVKGPAVCENVSMMAWRDGLLDAGATHVWFDLTADRPARARVEGLDESVEPLAALEQYLSSVGVNGHVGAALMARAGGYLERTRA